MNNFMKFLLCFLLSLSSYALEIDEKLTTRFIKVSRSKKTVLLNRGLEDGLVVGDHAKFFLTTGVIARGVVVKASPTRTIWSVYRIVNDNSIFPDKVVNIKITKPMTTTEDPTKSLYDNANFEAGNEVMAIRGDAPSRVRTLEDDGQSMSQSDKEELASFENMDDESMMLMSKSNRGGINPNKTFEAFGMLHLNALSSTVDEGEGNTFNGTDSTIDWSLGIEKYFNDPGSFLGKVSFTAHIHSSSKSQVSPQGQQASSTVFEYGVGAYYHFIAPPLSYGRLIGFGGVSLGVGSVEDTIDFLGSTTTQQTNLVSGSSSFFSAAVGMMYYTQGGFGLRAMLDYYQRAESYEFENGNNFNKNVAGPRLLLGLGYRF